MKIPIKGQEIKYPNLDRNAHLVFWFVVILLIIFGIGSQVYYNRIERIVKEPKKERVHYHQAIEVQP